MYNAAPYSPFQKFHCSVIASRHTSAIGSVLSGGVQAGAAVVEGVASSATVAAGGIVAAGPMSSMERGPMTYFVDSLFRRSAGVESAQTSERTMATMAKRRSVNRPRAREGLLMGVRMSLGRLKHWQRTKGEAVDRRRS